MPRHKENHLREHIHHLPCVVDDIREDQQSQHGSKNRSEDRGCCRIGKILAGTLQTGIAEGSQNSNLAAFLIDHSGHCGQTHKHRDKNEEQREDIADGLHLIDGRIICHGRVMRLSVKDCPFRSSQAVDFLSCLGQPDPCVFQFRFAFCLRFSEFLLSFFQFILRISEHSLIGTHCLPAIADRSSCSGDPALQLLQTVFRLFLRVRCLLSGIFQLSFAFFDLPLSFVNITEVLFQFLFFLFQNSDHRFRISEINIPCHLCDRVPVFNQFQHGLLIR